MSTTTTPSGARPAALYLPVDGLDVTAGKRLLQERGIDVLDVQDDPPAEALERVVALMAGYDRVDAELLDRLPGLRLVVTHSSGYDMVDLDAAAERGLWVSNLPSAATGEVAVHALAMALALVRRLPELDRDVRAGRWLADRQHLPRTPQTLTCGVVGMGRIGQTFASMAGGLFTRVVGYDPALPDSAWPVGVDRQRDLDDLLRVSDCISLHLPLAPDTRGLLDGRALALLPEGAIVVNVSRGELVDQAALLEAVRSGHLSGAACDVLAEEPPAPGDPVLAEERLLLSPHVAYLSPGSVLRYTETPARAVLALLDTGEPLHPVLRPPH